MTHMSLLAYIVNSMVAQDNDPRNIDRDIIRNYIVPRHITLEHHWSAVIGMCHHDIAYFLGAVSIRKTVLPGMAIPMLKIRRPNGRLILNMEIAIRR